jgi:hypothetical protein
MNVDYLHGTKPVYNVNNSVPCGSVIGRNSSAGIATRYGLDGPEIELRWGRNFPHPSRLVLGPTQPPRQWVLDHSRG